LDELSRGSLGNKNERDNSEAERRDDESKRRPEEERSRRGRRAAEVPGQSFVRRAKR